MKTGKIVGYAITPGKLVLKLISEDGVEVEVHANEAVATLIGDDIYHGMYTREDDEGRTIRSITRILILHLNASSKVTMISNTNQKRVRSIGDDLPRSHGLRRNMSSMLSRSRKIEVRKSSKLASSWIRRKVMSKNGFFHARPTDEDIYVAESMISVVGQKSINWHVQRSWMEGINILAEVGWNGKTYVAVLKTFGAEQWWMIIREKGEH